MITSALLAFAGATSTFGAGLLFGRSREQRRFEDHEHRLRDRAEELRQERSDVANELARLRDRFGLDRPELPPQAILSELVASSRLRGVSLGDEEGLESHGVGEATLRETLAAMASYALPFPAGDVILVRVTSGETLGLAKVGERAIVGLVGSGSFPTFAFQRAVFELRRGLNDSYTSTPLTAVTEPQLGSVATQVEAAWVAQCSGEQCIASGPSLPLPSSGELAALRSLWTAAAWTKNGAAGSIEWRRSSGAVLYVESGCEWIVGYEQHGIDDLGAEAVEGVIRRLTREAA